jgi:hypothetical protein
VLDLEHRALARLVGIRGAFRDDPVEPGPFEALEPLRGLRAIARDRSQVNGRRDVGEQLFQPSAPLRLRQVAQILTVSGQQVERDERRGRLRRQPGNPGCGRVQPHLEQVEVQALAGGDHDLAVEHAPGRQLRQSRLPDLREIAIERLELAALDVDLGLAPKDDRSEAVPFRLVENTVARGERARDLREHRLHRRVDGERPRFQGQAFGCGTIRI